MFANLNSNIAKFTLIALAYFVTAKLGLMAPYKESIITLMWLPTGIAVGAIMRCGYISLPAIYVAAFLVEMTLGVPLWASLAIASTNSLAPFFTAYLLKKFNFNHNLIKQTDIGLMIAVSLFSMLISATGGVLTLYLSGLTTPENINRIWFSWWVGDSLGILIALPLVLNGSKKSFRIKERQLYELVAWLLAFFFCELVITAWVTSLNRQFMLSILLILPVLIWASMNFGIVGGSLVVIILSTIAVWVTSNGYGFFYSPNVSEGVFSLWMFMVTLVVMMLLISISQAERNLAEKLLRSNDKKLRAVINGALDGIVTIDKSGALIEFNPAAERIFGYPKSQVIGKTLSEVMVPLHYRKAHDDGFRQFLLTSKKHVFDQRLELSAMRADGSEFPIELTITSVMDEEQSLVTGFIRDISQQKKAQQEIENFAYYDLLTGLPNRRLLIDRFHRAVLNSKRAQSYCALIYLDIDNFKILNDTKGHDVGDQFLIEVTRRIQLTLRAEDTVARLSGDEFIIIIENLDKQQDIAYGQSCEVAKKLLVNLNKNYQLKLFEFNTSASMGITLFNNEQLSFEDNLRHADTAMYQSKSAGRNTYHFYDQTIQEKLEKSFALEASLRLALKNNEFHLNYQSIVNVEHGIIGAEVLLRWTHPLMGNISPAEFIPIAEKGNQIIKIGHWVLEQACAQLKVWQHSPKLRDIKLSVNISAKQFLYIHFIYELSEIIFSTGINPNSLKLELTETAVIDNIDDVIHKLEELRAMGVHISLDDFGMGQSSLVYLKKLPVTQIKIDQSFVSDMLSDSNDAAIIQMILAIGKTIGCNIVAEGVEKVEQFEMLKSLGCSHFQGYYFSRPLNVRDFERLVNGN